MIAIPLKKQNKSSKIFMDKGKTADSLQKILFIVTRWARNEAGHFWYVQEKEIGPFSLILNLISRKIQVGLKVVPILRQ